jgi:uncharacterized protein (DUF2384 family)
MNLNIGNIENLFQSINSVFNNENDKFQRWLKKPNLSLGGKSPENLLDTITGIMKAGKDDVKNVTSKKGSVLISKLIFYFEFL